MIGNIVIVGDFNIDWLNTNGSERKHEMSGGIARFTRGLFELPCYPHFELEIHIVEVSYLQIF